MGSPFMGLWFCSYVLLGAFVVLNLVVFVISEKLTKAVREDKDQDAAKAIADVFQEGADESDEVTWEVFASKLDDPAMLDYFNSLDISASVADARFLFELIDVDHSGLLTAKEIVNGCLCLKGPARALEVALIMKDTAHIADMLAELRLI